jgi:hypothetical protein
MLAGENEDRKSPSGMPALSWSEDAAFEAPDSGGLFIGLCGRIAMALRNVRREVLRAGRAGARSSLRALPGLRQFGFATNFRRTRARDDYHFLARAADSRSAM